MKSRLKNLPFIPKADNYGKWKFYKMPPNFIYKGKKYSIYSINCFSGSKRGKNDKSNKSREIIINCIINDLVPDKYYIISDEWNNKKKGIFEYFHNLMTEKYPNDKIKTIKSEIKAGRKYNYDFQVTINNIHQFSIEFKFNAMNIRDAPQFVSPMKISQYLTQYYELYHYNNILSDIAKSASLTIPDKTTYLKSIHSNKPKCMKIYQDMYYKGCSQSSKYDGNESSKEFYNRCKSRTKEGIINFINKSDLNIEALSKYLLKTQNGKHYMMYKNGIFYYQYVNLDDFNIISYKKEPEKCRYLAKSKSGKGIKILIRWKNGNGIAFPAFQIS